MSNQKPNSLNPAKIKHLLEDLIQKNTNLTTIHNDLIDAMMKHGMDADRLKELFTMHLDDTKNYTFEQNAAAVFVSDMLQKSEFYLDGKNLINQIVEGPMSAEGYKSFALSYEQLKNVANRTGMSFSTAKEYMEQNLNDIKSPLWDSYRDRLPQLRLEHPYIRGDFDRGILEYCQDGDIDYAFSPVQNMLNDEFAIYKQLATAYPNMKKDESTDEMIELILKLLPTIYSTAPSLIQLHRNPDKAKQIYDEALAARPATKPAVSKMTQDIFGSSLFMSTTSSSSSSGSGGCYVATSVYGSYDCPQVWTLRRFRDDTLGSTWYGRAFIHTYYAISPTLVKWFGKTDWFKNFWRSKLDRMVEKLQANGVEDTPYDDKEW